MKNNLPISIRQLLVPLVVLVGIVFLNILALKIIIDNATRLNLERSNGQEALALLQTKASSLQIINTEIEGNSESVILALPDKNSVLLTVSQVRRFAQEQNLVVDSLQSTASTAKESGVNSTQISFNLNGSYQDIKEFVAKLENSAPLVSFSDLQIKSQNTSAIYDLEANIYTYWAPLPTTISAIDDPLVTLTAEEEKRLIEVSSLTRTATTQESVTSSPPGKTNPFQ